MKGERGDLHYSSNYLLISYTFSQRENYQKDIKWKSNIFGEILVVSFGTELSLSSMHVFLKGKNKHY